MKTFILVMTMFLHLSVAQSDTAGIQGKHKCKFVVSEYVYGFTSNTIHTAYIDDKSSSTISKCPLAINFDGKIFQLKSIQQDHCSYKGLIFGMKIDREDSKSRSNYENNLKQTLNYERKLLNESNSIGSPILRLLFNTDITEISELKCFQEKFLK